MFYNTHIHTHTPASSLQCGGVVRSSPGHPGWWQGNRTYTSWQAERALCAGWTGTWLPCCALNVLCSLCSTARSHNKHENGGTPRSDCLFCSPITEDGKEIHLREIPPPTFPKYQQPYDPPFPPFLFSPFLPSSSPPGDILTVSSCPPVCLSSGGIAQQHSAVMPRRQCFHMQTEALRLASEPHACICQENIKPRQMKWNAAGPLSCRLTIFCFIMS